MAMRRWPGAGHSLDSWAKEHDRSPVSEADLEVDRFLKRELCALLPSAGWLSEESVDHPERLEKGLCWLVDPIDGTRDFIRGRTGWAISVALISAQRPLIARLVAPARREWWQATAGRGALCSCRANVTTVASTIPMPTHWLASGRLPNATTPTSAAVSGKASSARVAIGPVTAGS